MIRYLFLLTLGLSLVIPIAMSAPMDTEGACSAPDLLSLDQRLEQKTQDLSSEAQDELGFMRKTSISKDGYSIDPRENYLVKLDYNPEGLDLQYEIPPPETTISVSFSEDEWKVMNVAREPDRLFHANDMFRKAFKVLRTERGFPRKLPTKIVRSTIVNEETVDTLGSINNVTDPQQFSDAFFNDTVHGKMTQRILTDFRLKATKLTIPANEGEAEFLEILDSIEVSVEPVSEAEEGLRASMAGASVSN